MRYRALQLSGPNRHEQVVDPISAHIAGSGGQRVTRAIEVGARFGEWRGGSPPKLLELPNGAIGLAAAGVHVEQLQSDGEIRRRDGEHIAQSLLATTKRRAIARLRLELGERV